MEPVTDYLLEQAALSVDNALSLLSSPDKWIKDVFARDNMGNTCSYLADEAKCFCLTGALARSAWTLLGVGNDDNLYSSFTGVYNLVCMTIMDIITIQRNDLDIVPIITVFNDDPRITYEDIISVLQQAKLKLS